ncbi:hypothetical protein LIA77_04081 [Sarocladium implicatum]|nr:hypothetical protein LIA77_04081 [Sarocladium implicatum]
MHVPVYIRCHERNPPLLPRALAAMRDREIQGPRSCHTELRSRHSTLVTTLWFRFVWRQESHVKTSNDEPWPLGVPFHSRLLIRCSRVVEWVWPDRACRHVSK